MSENNLFQFAQVIAELPIQNSPQTANGSHQHHSNYHSRYLHIRKNACVVCSICFTCSKYYGIDCNCQEIQPRRGKNLPEGGLDSRAKKLHREDGDDFEFSIKWINENAHNMYKDENGTVLGLRDLSEVSLCKAHSSTLYRAKKRHERGKYLVPQHHQHPAPPSPAESDQYMHTNSNGTPNPYPMSSNITSGGLAAKVREISSNQSYQPQVLRMHDVPDFSRMSHSTSVKRKRTFNNSSIKSPKLEQSLHNRPSSSISTPLFASSSRINSSTANHQFMQTPPPPPLFGSSLSTNLPMSQEFQQHIQQQVQQQQQVHMQQQHHHQQQQQHIVDTFPSQLPPLHSRGPSVSSLPSVPQQQQQQQQSMQLYHQHHHTSNKAKEVNTASRSSALLDHSAPSSPVIKHESMEITSPPASVVLPPIMIETVSLKSSNSPDAVYYFRNLAITDNFTFRDLLAEIDMTGAPPPGKRIVISDSEKFYPLDQAIRSVIRRPASTHLDLCLGLTDKPSINWNTYS